MKELKNLKTFEDACKIEGLDPEKVIPDFSCYPVQDHSAMIAHAKLVIIARAANRLANKGVEWKPDWTNNNQWKYYPWFEMYRGSSGFRFGDFDLWHSYSYVGSRLCFLSREVGEYVATTFLDLYRSYFFN